MTIKLIVGLRNPGSAYEATRHNAGAWYVNSLASHYNLSLKVNPKFHGEVGQFSIQDHTCFVILPTTFMNESGLAVRAVTQFYRIPAEEILVIHDELDLPVGRIKLKTGGGNGGHNGLRDIITHLGHSNFHRLRIGIGHPGHKELVSNYVLGKPSIADTQLINEAIDNTMAVVPELLAGHLSKAMNIINT